MTAPPRYATQPNPTASHELAAVELMAKRLRTPLLEWQAQVARVATERHPTIPGAWRYPIVVVTVPRQSGKTTLMRAVMAQRAFTRPRLTAFYTAQTGKDARERWMDLVQTAEDYFPTAVEIKRGAGAESFTWAHSKGAIRVFAPTAKALHGYTPALVMLDEIFAHDEITGNALMGAIIPAQQTLPDRQLWLVSTAGTTESVFLREWVDKGRAAVGDPSSGIAYFEWSMPDDLDPYQFDAFQNFHPAWGKLLTRPALEDAAASMSRAEFERAYCNRWTIAANPLIPLEVFNQSANPNQTPPTDPYNVAFAFDVELDRSSAAIWAAWTASDGLTQTKLVYAAPGVDWLIPTLQDLPLPDGRAIHADDGGSTRAYIDAARNAGLLVEAVPMRELASATSDWLHAITVGSLQHDGTNALSQAVQGAVKRQVGEVDLISRRNSTAGVAHLIASIVAVRAHTYTPAPAPAPLIISA